MIIFIEPSLDYDKSALSDLFLFDF